MARMWRDDGLSLVLAIFFAPNWALQRWTGWLEFVSQERPEG
jgi:hypothetical protein